MRSPALALLALAAAVPSQNQGLVLANGTTGYLDVPYSPTLAPASGVTVDFATSNGIHRVGGNKKGVFTRDRQPKAAAWALRRRWRGLDGAKPAPATHEN